MAKSEIINNDALTVRVDESITDAVGNVVDTVGDAVDLIEKQAERVITVTKNNPWLIAGAFVVGIGVGGFLAYKYVGKKLSLGYDVQLQEELEKTRVFYSRLNKQDQFSTPQEAAAALIPAEAKEALIAYQTDEKISYNDPSKITVTPPTEDPRPPIANVFDKTADPRDWNWEEEMEKRAKDPGSPYVITTEEFTDNMDHHEQITLTYYAGDDVLADDKDKPVDNSEYTVGDSNLTRFGHGSNDNKVVYIRNERISADFEVILSEGSYSIEVLGMEAGELRHSAVRHPNRMTNRSTPRKFREHDDE